MPDFKQRQKDTRGFSLIELLIATTVVLVVLGIITSILAGMNRQFSTQRDRIESGNNAQAAADTIIRTIRVSGNRPVDCDPSFIVPPPAPSSPLNGGYFGVLRVRSDWNQPDCTLNGVDEDVTFSVANEVLYMDANRQVPFVNKITALRFKLYDQDSVAITDPAMAGGTKFVRVEIDTVSPEGIISTLVTGTALRR